MPRPPRPQFAGARYHLMSRGVARLPVFRDDEDRDAFLTMFGKVVRELGWKCLGYCLMETHYHLVVETPEPNLARGMQRLNSCFAANFNRRHGGRGHVFERRYHAVVVESEGHLFTLHGYLAANPLRVGLCSSAEEWRYGSYGALLTGSPTAGLLDRSALEQFHRDPRRAVELLRLCVEGYLASTA